jgi:hypothetical protein
MTWEMALKCVLTRDFFPWHTILTYVLVGVKVRYELYFFYPKAHLQQMLLIFATLHNFILKCSLGFPLA